MQNYNKYIEHIKTTWTRSEVAEMFNISTKTLHDWLEERQYELRPRKAITVKELNEIFAFFGDPRPYIAAERERLALKRGKK
jgi:hypothetical protein